MGMPYQRWDTMPSNDQSAGATERPQWGYVIRRWGQTDFTGTDWLAKLHMEDGHSEVTIATWSFSQGAEQ